METIYGDLLEETEGIIVHGCNAQGVMGSGIAKSIRDKWPGVYEDYKTWEEKRRLLLGDIIVTPITDKLVVVSAITQRFYGRDPNQVYSDQDAIYRCFERIAEYALILSIFNDDMKFMRTLSQLPPVWPATPHIKFPLIGCGQANGDWTVVGPMIDSILKKVDIPGTLFIKK